MSTSTPTANTTTVFGSLAWDPTERFTAEKTGTQMVPDPAVPVRMVAKRFRIPGRPYITLMASVVVPPVGRLELATLGRTALLAPGRLTAGP